MKQFHEPAAGTDEDEDITPFFTSLFIFSCTTPHSELIPLRISVLPGHRK